MNTSFSTSLPKATLAKAAVVTGAASDIGKETVRRLLADGFVVHAAARRFDEMADLERDGAILHYLDLCDDASIRACAAAIYAYGELTRTQVAVVTNEDGQEIYTASDVMPGEVLQNEVLHRHSENSLFDLSGMMDRLKSLFVQLPPREPSPAVVKAACQ